MKTRIAILLLCGALSLGAGSRGLCATYTAERWRAIEITLTGAKQHANPFGDVTVDATFTGPGMKLVRPAFWDGGATWKIRFAAPATGTWSSARAGTA